MDDLIARLEAADKGTRELDEAIATEIWGPPKPSGNVGHERVLVWWDRGCGRSIAPEFTSSLDAALTLLPEGWNWQIENDGHVEMYASSPKYDDIVVDARTPALAICIAALRARRKSSDDPGSGSNADPSPNSGSGA